MVPANSEQPVGSGVFAATALLTISFAVLLILRYYLPLRTTPAYLLVPAFFALWLPACIAILMPIDVASSARLDDEAHRGIWLPERVLLVSWRITYWLTFALTWFILPILGEYSDSGYREPMDKVLYSIRANAQYQLAVFGCGSVGLVYVFVTYGVSFSSLKGLVMALAYCWGLALAIYLMGHGLVAIPRRLLRNASISGRLRRIQARAPRVFERLEDAEISLEEIEMQVSELDQRRGGSVSDFREWIEELVDMLTSKSHSRPRTFRGNLQDGHALPTVITQKYMADLTRRLMRAQHAHSRYADEWYRTVQEAVETQAILDSAASKKLDFGASSPARGFWHRRAILTPYTRYLVHYHIIPYVRIFFGAFLGLASVSIVWSELVKSALPPLSVIRYTVVHHWTGDSGQVGFAGQVIAASWLLYMCAAALTSITEVKVWRGRALVRRNTAHESALWYASQVARLSVPLSYNFMTLLSPKIYKKTVFYHFLGELITMTTASTWFDYVFPVLILLPVCAALFGFYGRVKRLFGSGLDIAGGEEGNEAGFGTGSWREGRELIKRELNGTSIRNRLADVGSSRQAAAGAAGARAMPILSAPGGAVEPSPTPLGRPPSSRPLANTSARRLGGPPLAAAQRAAPLAGVEDENFFDSLGHRFKNTIDTIDTPQWLHDIGQGIKKPKWMGGDDDGDVAGGSRQPENTIRRWFGGGDGNGRIRL